MDDAGAVAEWTLITVTYNSAEALRNFWSPPPSTVDWIVVDNDSRDDTREVATSLGARVVALPENVGFGAANNIGMANAKSELIGFVNPDVTVDYPSLPAMAAVVGDGKRIAAPQLLNSDGSKQPNGRGFPLVANKLRNRGSKSESLRDQYLLYAEPGQLRHVCWFIGAAVLGHRSAFDRIRVWDTKFFIYYEDSDLCLRAWAEGIPSIVVGDVNWVHGWARETTGLKWAPWKRELASMRKFYSRYPVLMLGNRLAARRYSTISETMQKDGWRWR